MIRSRLHNPVIKSASYDAETETMIIEMTTGSVVKYSPAPFGTYDALVTSRFPEKVYRHQVKGIIPERPGI